MANSYTKGRMYIDSTGEIVATDRKVRIEYAIFIPNSNGDEVVIGETSTGAPALVLSSPTGKEPVVTDFSRRPIIMDGVYVQTLDSNCRVLLYTTTAGGR